MRAMILAAGRGERMGKLTEYTPKPLLKVHGKYLIEYALQSLIATNIKEIVINVSYKAELIQQTLGDGNQYGVQITYSIEKERLETGGGILNALHLLGRDPFIVISSDIITDFKLQKLTLPAGKLAHLILVDNPSFHPQGDFGLTNNLLNRITKPTFTFANMGIYDPAFFSNATPGYFPLSKLLFPAIDQGLISAEHYHGLWFNIGKPEDLEEAKFPF